MPLQVAAGCNAQEYRCKAGRPEIWRRTLFFYFLPLPRPLTFARVPAALPAPLAALPAALAALPRPFAAPFAALFAWLAAPAAALPCRVAAALVPRVCDFARVALRCLVAAPFFAAA